ncbi:HIT domain-containing protein [Loa loa]|uniref:Adenosine 5'-monophosphoramidase HINT3 n=1 Tax=Loa loa TaxID=7209 RepID=A0A1I7VSV6_LOALO|nr:HIT domain-containing protein [Loa loa]EFO16100.1 HIT domain-containing protein [Loa loa]
MATAVRGCVFCGIIHGQRDKHLKASENAVLIQDRSPHAPHHYLILSRLHINRASDLTVVDLPLVKEMDRLGRDYLRETLKGKGEADTVEDLLRMGFHWSVFVTVRHLHMHLLYPTREMNFLYRAVVFRSGRFFRTTKSVIDNLEKKRNACGQRDPTKEVKSGPSASGQNDSSVKNITDTT